MEPLVMEEYAPCDEMRALPLFCPILKANDTISLFIKVRFLGTLVAPPPPPPQKVLGGNQADGVLNNLRVHGHV